MLQWSPEFYLGDIGPALGAFIRAFRASMEPRVLSRGYVPGGPIEHAGPPLQWSPEFYLGDMAVRSAPLGATSGFNGAPSFISGISLVCVAGALVEALLQWSPEFYLGDIVYG